MLKIKNVIKNSVGDELGLKIGDCITHFNNKKVQDIFDYIFYDGQTDFEMQAICGNAEVEFEVEKFEDESLGLEFDYELDTIKCQNKCMFCFIHQLPKGMRKTLYIKDDDWRQSLLNGNFVTLTNMNDAGINRIIDMHMSPLYISVHTTNGTLRQRMLSNKLAGNILEKLQKLSDNGISIHCQIVLLKGVNDGAQLDTTLSDLCRIENVLSVAIVPVGLTKHRDKLCVLQPIDLPVARETIKIADKYNGDKQIICSDELYLQANLPVKSFEEYGDFPHIENGVGMIAKFEHEFYNYAIPKKYTPKKVTVITGYSSYEIINNAVLYIQSALKDITINLQKIRNDFFGESITVTGLITGGDIINQLKGQDLGDYLIIPKVMLKEFDTVFLDDISINDIEEALNIKTVVSDTSGQSFWNSIIK